MALTITTTITVNDDEAYTAREAAILAAIAAHPSSGAPAPAPAAEKPAVAPMVARTRAAKAAKPAAAAETSTQAAVLDTSLDEPAEKADDNDEAALAAMEADLAGETPTLQDAVTKATAAISAGKQAQVKAALNAAGAKRVSELKGDGIATFINALEG